MITNIDVFVKGLAEHIEEAANGEAGRHSLLCEGAAIATSYFTRFGELHEASKGPLTLEQVRPGAMSLENNPLVDLFYTAAEDAF